MALCRLIMGPKSCEQINEFTSAPKCPPKYIRTDHTTCTKDCGNAGGKITLDFKCGTESVEYLNDFQVFESKEECEKEVRFCVSKGGSGQGEWVQECPPHKLKIGFMCVPTCLSEMGEDLKRRLEEDDRYCVEDFVSTGIPFYDLN